MQGGSFRGPQQQSSDERHPPHTASGASSVRAKVCYNAREPFIRFDRKFFRPNPTRRYRVRPAPNAEILDLWGSRRFAILVNVLRPAGKQIFCAVRLVKPDCRIHRLLVGPENAVGKTGQIDEAQAQEFYAIASRGGTNESDLDRFLVLLTQSAGEA
jgi:hypothetical protein